MQTARELEHMFSTAHVTTMVLPPSLRPVIRPEMVTPELVATWNDDGGLNGVDVSETH